MVGVSQPMSMKNSQAVERLQQRFPRLYFLLDLFSRSLAAGWIVARYNVRLIPMLWKKLW
jgi:hypothetical protein